MKTRLTLALVAAAALLTAGLATGGAVFLLGAALLTLLTLSSFAAVCWAARTMETQVELSARTVRRGDSVTLTVRRAIRDGLPIAPVTLTLSATPDMPETQVSLRDAPGKSQCLTMPFHASHVGVCAPGVTRCQVEDVLGLFSRMIIPARNGGELTVLPMTFPVEPLTFAPGESGSEEVARATEDITNPSDVRSYQPGDAMKKIHWKLSLRKRELMVRRFEEPILPDGLILLDCSPPPSWGHPEAEADVRRRAAGNRRLRDGTGAWRVPRHPSAAARRASRGAGEAPGNAAGAGKPGPGGLFGNGSLRAGAAA